MEIAGCIVNHNTSAFAELALRSLLRTGLADVSDRTRVTITVLDNHSDDPDLDALRECTRRLGVSLQPSSYPAGRHQVNTHGDVLADFVRSNSDADAILFVDPDIEFTRPAVGALASTLSASPTTWAVQARLDSPAGLVVPTRRPSLVEWTRDARRAATPAMFRRFPRTGTGFLAEFNQRAGVTPRCHPACALVRNTSQFREIADAPGLSPAIMLTERPGSGGFFDTLALATHIMKARGYEYVVSAAAVTHYGAVSYDLRRRKDVIAAKRAHCRMRLQEVREG